MAWLIPVLPLAGFALLGLGRNHLPKAATTLIGCGSILGSFILSLLMFKGLGSEPVLLHYFDFIKVSTLNIGFDFTIDPLSGLFLLIITGIGFLIHVYSSSYMHEESSAHFARYFAYLNLFVFSMLLLVMGSNLVVMFIGWEGVGLCSYLLIGYWFRNVQYGKAAQKAFVMNRIGDLGFLLAIFWIIARAGTVSFHELFSAAGLEKFNSFDITCITLLLLLGATGKSAQIPLYTWLPDAMAGPTPVSALIHAATMVTAGIYMVARSNVFFTLAPHTQDVMLIIGLSTAFLAATVALRQNDIKKVLAYSTVSQLGFMFLALGSGAYIAAIFHVMTHAFFKALLFLGAGSVIHAMSGEQNMQQMGGLKKKLPVTHLTFLIGCLAIAGIPPLSGFFSKDEILAAAFGKSPVIWGIALLVALMTAFYMFRMYALTFNGSFRGSEEQKHHLHESPAAMTVPLIVLAILSVVGGWIGIPEVLMHGAHRLSDFLSPVFSESFARQQPHHLSHTLEYGLMISSVLLVLLSLTLALRRFSGSAAGEKDSALGRFLENKWYVDELYDKVINKPLLMLSGFLHRMVEIRMIDGLVNGIGRAVHYGSRQLRWLQSGQVGAYVLLMTIGMLVLLIIKYYL